MKKRIKKIVNNSFLSHRGFRRYFANTSWLMAEKIFRMIIGLAVGIYVARYLGPERFGVLSYAMSVVALFSALSSLGLNSILVRELVSFPEKRNDFLGTAFTLKLAGAGIVLLLFTTAFYFTPSSRQNNLIIFIIAAGLLFQSFNVIQFYFEAKVLARFTVAAQITALALISIVRLICIWLELPLIYFALAVLAESLVLAAGLVVVYFKHKLSILSWRFRLKTATGLLKDSWPLILSGICITLHMYIDQIMIGCMIGYKEVGKYAAATRLVEALYFIPVVVCASLFPALINSRKIGMDVFNSRLQSLHSTLVWCAVIISLVLTIAASDIISFLYGADFYESYKILIIHSWGLVFSYSLIVRGKWILIEEFQKVILYSTLSRGILNVILNFVMIPLWGVIGAAIATIASRILIFYLIPLIFMEVRPTLNSFHKSFLLPARFKFFK